METSEKGGSGYGCCYGGSGSNKSKKSKQA